MNNPIVRIPLKYAFFGGLLAFALVLLLFYAGTTHPQLFPVFLDFRILLFGVFIFFSIKEFKDGIQNGVLHFWQGMIIGVICYAGIAWVASIGIVGLGELDPGYLSTFISETTSVMTGNKEAIIEKVGVEAYNAQMEVLPSTSVFTLAFDYFLKSMLIGLFLTIIISVILRKQPNN